MKSKPRGGDSVSMSVKLLLASLFLVLVPGIASAQRAAGCERVDPSEKTFWGWIKENNPTEGGVFQKLEGRVILPDESVLSGALVELFNNPDLDVDKRKRLAACRTGDKGFFRFKGVRPGKYEIRASYGRGLDAGQTMVNLDPKNKDASKKDIIVRMEISN